MREARKELNNVLSMKKSRIEIQMADSEQNGAAATEMQKGQTSAVSAHLFSEVWKKKQSCILEVWRHQVTVREKVWGLICV